MLAHLAEATMSLDIGTLFVIATCVTALLGLFLLFAWMQDRIQALAWWGMAYLIGGFSGALWRLGQLVSPPLPSGMPDVLLFIAVGMIWSAARILPRPSGALGRDVLWRRRLALPRRPSCRNRPPPRHHVEFDASSPSIRS